MFNISIRAVGNLVGERGQLRCRREGGVTRCDTFTPARLQKTSQDKHWGETKVKNTSTTRGVQGNKARCHISWHFRTRLHIISWQTQDFIREKLLRGVGDTVTQLAKVCNFVRKTILWNRILTLSPKNGRVDFRRSLWNLNRFFPSVRCRFRRPCKESLTKEPAVVTPFQAQPSYLTSLQSLLWLRIS